MTKHPMSLLRSKILLTLTLLTFICFIVVIFLRPASKYSVSYDDARNIGGPLYECSGMVIKYTSGFRCDGYAPNKIFWVVLFLGILLSLLVAVVILQSKFKHIKH